MCKTMLPKNYRELRQRPNEVESLKVLSSINFNKVYTALQSTL